MVGWGLRGGVDIDSLALEQGVVMVVVLSSLDDDEPICKPVPFMDIEKAIKSSVGTTTPVFSVSNTLKRLLITTSASALPKIFSMFQSSYQMRSNSLGKNSRNQLGHLKSVYGVLRKINFESIPKVHDLHFCESC